MEPFEYDDYSEFDADELDYVPPFRSIQKRERSRRLSPFEVDVDEDAIEKIRSRARMATTNFLDECDSARDRAKKRDKEFMRQIDTAITQNPLVSTKPWRRHSLATARLSTEPAEPPEKVELMASPMRNQTPKISSGRDGPLENINEPNAKERLSTRRKMREVESKLENILDYELPSHLDFKDMRNSLREINDKMAKHRFMIDRYSGLQMKDDNQPIEERVAAKVEELVPRVAALSGVQHHFGSRGADIESDFDPRLVPGYSTGLCITPNESSKELRGRIRNLLCRTRETSKKDAANPHLKPFEIRRRELTVE